MGGGFWFELNYTFLSKIEDIDRWWYLHSSNNQGEEDLLIKNLNTITFFLMVVIMAFNYLRLTNSHASRIFS